MSMSKSVSEDLNIDFEELLISPSEYKRIAFEEELYLVDSEGQVIDEVTVAVVDMNGEFMVYQYSQNEGCMLRVQSEVYPSLDTKSEIRRIRQPEKMKMLRVTESLDKYKVFRLSIDGKDGSREHTDIYKSDPLVLEGANIILIRKIAMSWLSGRLRAQNINHEGELCPCEYQVEHGERYEVIVRRILTDSQGQEVMTTVLTREGRIIQHTWSRSEWYLISREQQPTEEDEGAEESDQTIIELEVKADKEAYFEKKEFLLQMFRMYFLQNTDVQDMIADFLKNLLFAKPRDVIGFADQYFSEFMGIIREPTLTETPSLHSDENLSS